MVTVGQLLKWLGIIVILAVLFLGGYVWYRYNAAASFLKNEEMFRSLSTARAVLAYVRGMPPIRCQSVTTNFTGALREVLYIANGSFRESIEDISKRDSETGNTLHIVGNASGLYAWRTGSDTAKKIGIDVSFESSGTAGGAALVDISSCEPWWNVDPSLLKVPSNYLIEDVRM